MLESFLKEFLHENGQAVVQCMLTVLLIGTFIWTWVESKSWPAGRYWIGVIGMAILRFVIGFFAYCVVWSIIVYGVGFLSIIHDFAALLFSERTLSYLGAGLVALAICFFGRQVLKAIAAVKQGYEKFKLEEEQKLFEQASADSSKTPCLTGKS